MLSGANSGLIMRATYTHRSLMQQAA